MQESIIIGDRKLGPSYTRDLDCSFPIKVKKHIEIEIIY
uniref:Uncharacterized protein n=1 Tax=Lepeophtheirus salmonis TaxID=72036 RepID=A0A0K2T9Z3_LEPSM